MTEEIIIDCAFYKDGVCASPINKTCEYCKNIDVSKCYHKQLKRLEQENKELKEENKTLNYQWHKQSEIGDEWYKIAERYRSALEEIRENIQNWINSPWSCCNCRNNMDERLTEIKNKINEVLQ